MVNAAEETVFNLNATRRAANGWVEEYRTWAETLDSAGRNLHTCISALERAEWDLKVAEAKAYLSCDGKSEDIRKAQLTTKLAEDPEYFSLREKQEKCSQAVADARSDFSNAEIGLKLANNVLIIYRGIGADER